jgi:hypothetical protein
LISVGSYPQLGPNARTIETGAEVKRYFYSLFTKGDAASVQMR